MPNIVTQIVPEAVSGDNFIFQKTRKGPLMQFTNHGLVCLMATAETRIAQMIKASHTDIYRKNYDKNLEGSFDTVLADFNIKVGMSASNTIYMPPCKSSPSLTALSFNSFKSFFE